MDPIDGKFTAFGWKTPGHQRQRHGRGPQGPRPRPRRQGAADLHRLLTHKGQGILNAAHQAGRRRTSTASRSRPSTSTRRWPRSSLECQPDASGEDGPRPSPASPALQSRAERCRRHGGSLLRIAVETRAGQGHPRRLRPGARGPRGRPSRPRRGRRRRGQLDPDRVVRQEVSRPVLQHRDRREQPRRDRRRPGQRGQDEPDRQLRGVHHLQRLRPVADVGRLPAPERQGRRQPRRHLDRRGRRLADGDRGRRRWPARCPASW